MGWEDCGTLEGTTLKCGTFVRGFSLLGRVVLARRA